MDTSNPELQLADAYVRDTGCHIFLTGKAGTGKTTFLHGLKKKRPKRLVVAAPTGVAAINAGGVTLHSFFQLPFGPYVPGSQSGHSQYRFSNEKIGIIKSMDLLVIDEVSMVRADLLDGVDSVLRRYRRSDRPFAGVQLLMIGDLYQLPPVVPDADWRILKHHYASPYFFSSKALDQADMVTIELQHIYRQADPAFIHLLNQVRSNQLDPAALEALNARHVPDFRPAVDEGCITLCTHNRQADTINESRLGSLPATAHRFDAEIEGDFPESIFPTAETLQLKAGAQVMFVRNDPSPEKRYFNGKIGSVVRINGNEVHVQCPEDAASITVEPATWENIEYSLDRKNLEITATVIGTFRQLPLRLAWAITIHKSQGLTFDKAIIDAQAAFAYGQVYVALSRCRTLEGMVLSRPLPSSAIKTDPAVVRFSQEARRQAPSPQQLDAARIRYQQQLLLECFDFGRLRTLLRRLVGLLLNHAGVVQVAGVEDMRSVQERIEDGICAVGDRFRRQLEGLFTEAVLPSDKAVVVDRITKASAYFNDQLNAETSQSLFSLQVETDNQTIKRKINNALKTLREEIGVKQAAVQACQQGFSPSGYFRAVAAAAIGAAKPKAAVQTAPTYSEADIAHPELFQILKEWRSRKAQEEGVPHYRVLHQKTLIQIAVNLPDTLDAFREIKGIGERLAERYGDELVALVDAYRKEKKIETVTLPTPTIREVKPKIPNTPRIDTKQASLELFEQGMTLAQIAEKRGLVLATIEGHIAHWVAQGKVAIDRLVPPEKRQIIERELTNKQGQTFRTVKQALGKEISYGEIRLVQAHLKRQAESDQE